MCFVMILYFMCLLLFFFFKQKTAYEMRISDWSSDVCSSDLEGNYLDTLTSANFVFATASPTNQAPVLSTPLLDQNATENTPFSYVVPATSFTDPDNDSLSYTAALANGSGLPGWLVFDAASRTFSGTPSDTASGTYSIQVTATDGSNATVSDSFTLAVQDVPAAPIVINGTPNNDTLTGTAADERSEEHTSEHQSLMRISYAVFY